MEVNLLRFPHKKIRSQAIAEYMAAAGYERAVCFSCGNAARELAAAGVDVLHIGERGDFTPNRWFSQKEIARIFPGYFDATSGHLPIELMACIAKKFKEYLGDSIAGKIYVPTGSGETIVCLKLAYPDVDFVAVYNIDAATEYNEGAPLNDMVRLLAHVIIW